MLPFWRVYSDSSKLLLLLILLPGLLGAQTTVTASLAASPNPSVYGAPVTLTATVTPSGATGRVTFYDGTAVLGIGTISNGQASVTTSMLPSGTSSLRAHYSGASGYNPSNSTSILQTVTPVPAGKLQQGSTPGAGCSSPVAIAAGDLNGDGNVDLVVACSGTVSVLLGTGTGTFAPAVTYPVGTPTALVLADFNGDGKLDVAVTDGPGGTVNLLLGNGDGTLQPMGAGFPVGATPSGLAAGDFNGDGNVDLASANFGDGTASILLGNGDGTFQRAKTLTANPGSISVAIADFNSDGFADLAVLNQTVTSQIPSTVMVFLGNGDGTFQAPAQYQTVPGGGTFYPSAVIAADFDGDGQPDLAAASFGIPSRGSFVSVFTAVQLSELTAGSGLSRSPPARG